MSTIPMASSVSARQSSIPGHHNGPSKRMRFSLSSLQSPSSNGTAHLTQRDIEALQRKGLLPAVVSSSQSTTTNSTSQASSSHLSTSGSSPPKASTTISTEQIPCTKPPLPIAERVAPLNASPKTKHAKAGSKLKATKDSDLIIHYKERLLPAYHRGVIEDTCSHLHTSTNIRRHSDSSSLASPVTRNPLSEDTLTLDSIRRASIATASPVIPSPLGGRTVLYKASYAHTLLSLPSKTAYTELGQDGESITNVGPTPEMNNFKFPAEENRSRTPTSPAMPSTATMSPTMPYRSKRKSSIPMRSPTWNDTQDSSPGVVFRLPFGTPPLPSAPFRKATTPSAQPPSSPRMDSLEEESNAGGSTPPTSYPSPASSSRATSASGPSSGSETQESQEQSIRFETPPSPANRSGLGIQVQESFSEPGATHPLESSSLISAAIASSQSQPITFREEDSSISIGDIIVAEQASAAQRQATRLAGLLGAAENNPAELVSMPTPPLTSRVLPMRVMESILERQYSPRVGQGEGTNLASPPTPFTPGPGFASSQAIQKSHGSSSSSSQISFEILNLSLEAKMKTQEIKSTDNAMELDQDQDRGSRAGSTCSRSTPAKDDQEKDEDPSVLPLWAQRQNHIRRQSLIPRPELDFVKGSGILPPANKGLITPGGAKILSYPVLISDMVHVALDELQAKSVALDGSDISEESEEDAEQQQIQHSAARGSSKLNTRGVRNINGAKVTNNKRKKGSINAGKRRGSTIGGKSQSYSQGDEEYQSGEEYPEDLEGADEHNGQQGYMTSQFIKRRRVSSLKQNTLDHEMLMPNRPVSERNHSNHRRRGSNAVGHSASPSASPHMGTSPSFRSGNGLGSPVELGRTYAYENDMDDEEYMVMEDEADGLVDIDDDEDVNSQLRRHSNYHQQHSHRGQHKDAIRRSHVPEHLRIPASELDIAVQLTREMIESAKKRPHKKEKSKTYNNRPSLKTLKPLLDATMKADRRRHRANDDDDDDENDNDDGDEHDMDEREMSKTVGNNGQSSSSIKKAAKMAMDQNGVAAPKKVSKPKEGKMTTKRCEACGASETPCWRPGYTAHSALCNSCGLRYKKSNVFCAKVGCKYIPLKTEYAAMEAERLKANRAHLLCHKCKGPVALPVPKE